MVIPLPRAPSNSKRIFHNNQIGKGNVWQHAGAINLTHKSHFALIMEPKNWLNGAGDIKMQHQHLILSKMMEHIIHSLGSSNKYDKSGSNGHTSSGYGGHSSTDKSGKLGGSNDHHSLSSKSDKAGGSKSAKSMGYVSHTSSGSGKRRQQCQYQRLRQPFFLWQVGQRWQQILQDNGVRLPCLVWHHQVWQVGRQSPRRLPPVLPQGQ